MEEFLNNPVQLAAIYRLQKKGLWHNGIKNPIGELMLTIFNENTPDELNFSSSVRDDLEKMVYDLSLSSANETDNFLFTTTEVDKQSQERIASELLLNENDEQLRKILIAEVLFDAMGTNLENWPRGSIHESNTYITPESEEIYLTKYGLMLKTHLESEHPEMYKELQENGNLDQFCQERQDRAIDLREHLVDQGMNYSEANEVAVSQLLEIAPEKEELSREERFEIFLETVRKKK